MKRRKTATVTAWTIAQRSVDHYTVVRVDHCWVNNAPKMGKRLESWTARATWMAMVEGPITGDFDDFAFLADSTVKVFVYWVPTCTFCFLYAEQIFSASMHHFQPVLRLRWAGEGGNERFHTKLTVKKVQVIFNTTPGRAATCALQMCKKKTPLGDYVHMHYRPPCHSSVYYCKSRILRTH